MKNRNAIFTYLLFTLLCALPVWATAGVYSWKDEHGKTHYGDRPPVDHAAEEVRIRVNTYSAPDENAITDTQKTSKGKVILYTTKTCGYCNQAKSYLKRRNIRYTEYDVEASNKGRRDFKKLNGTGVPIIMVGEQRMNGFSEGRLAGLLKNAGYE